MKSRKEKKVNKIHRNKTNKTSKINRLLLTFPAGLILSLLFVHTLLANVIVVSSNASLPAQYDSLQEGLSHAQAGDTIYLYPSDDTYAEQLIQIDKAVVIIGAWFNNPSNIFLGKSTKLGNININGVAGKVMIANCEINLLSISNASASATFNDVELVKNYIERLEVKKNDDNTFTSSKVLIRNNLIKRITFDWDAPIHTAKINIENNIIATIESGKSNFLVIKNNIFAPNFLPSVVALNDVSHALITKNIFWGRNFTSSMGLEFVRECIVYQNLCYQTIDVFDIEVNNNNDITENITQEDPLFLSSDPEFSSLEDVLKNNLDIGGDSPAVLGEQKDNMGITGGEYPYNHRTRYGTPIVDFLDITNPVNNGDSIRVIIKTTYEGEH